MINTHKTTIYILLWIALTLSSKQKKTHTHIITNKQKTKKNRHENFLCMMKTTCVEARNEFKESIVHTYIYNNKIHKAPLFYEIKKTAARLWFLESFYWNKQKSRGQPHRNDSSLNFVLYYVLIEKKNGIKLFWRVKWQMIFTTTSYFSFHPE